MWASLSSGTSRTPQARQNKGNEPGGYLAAFSQSTQSVCRVTGMTCTSLQGPSFEWMWRCSQLPILSTLGEPRGSIGDWLGLVNLLHRSNPGGGV